MIYFQITGFELDWVKFYLYFLAVWAIFASVAYQFLTNRIPELGKLSLIVDICASFFLAILYVLASMQKVSPCINNLQLGNENQRITQNLKGKILSCFNEKKLFLKKDLSIWDVCCETNSNRTYVSNLINEEFGLNFNSFVNKFRVEEAKMLLKTNNQQHDSFEKIANLSGFNSLASFNRAFKKFEGKSPGSIRTT